MKELLHLILTKLKSCGICYGLGTIEIRNGDDTIECGICKGSGTV